MGSTAKVYKFICPIFRLDKTSLYQGLEKFSEKWMDIDLQIFRGLLVLSKSFAGIPGSNASTRWQSNYKTRFEV